MNSNIYIATLKSILWVSIGIILRLLYDKYIFREKVRKEIEETMNTPGEIKIISFNNPKSIRGSHHDYIGFFYDWVEFKRYINTRDPEKYLNKVFSIEICHKIHYYLIVSDCVIEEVSIEKECEKEIDDLTILSNYPTVITLEKYDKLDDLGVFNSFDDFNNYRKLHPTNMYIGKTFSIKNGDKFYHYIIIDYHTVEQIHVL